MRATGPRGAPVVALAFLLTGWVALRAVVVQIPERAAAPMACCGAAATTGRSDSRAAQRDRQGAMVAESGGHRLRATTPMKVASAGPGPAKPARQKRANPVRQDDADEARRPAPPAGFSIADLTPFARLAPPFRREAAPARPAVSPSPARRWSADGWVLLRGGSGAGLAAGAPSYGGSQAGAVLRHALAPGSVLDPRVYLRLASAIDRARPDRQAALGVALRPLGQVPVQLLAELRASSGGGQWLARSAVAAVMAPAPVALPAHVVGEAYAEAGWVSGPHGTAFFDVQASAMRKALGLAPGLELHLGGGAWAGGQRDAARLDLGPRLSLHGRIGQAGARLSLDWRLRVAGRADPGSGPALTLAASF